MGLGGSDQGRGRTRGRVNLSIKPIVPQKPPDLHTSSVFCFSCTVKISKCLLGTSQNEVGLRIHQSSESQGALVKERQSFNRTKDQLIWID